MKRVDDNRRNDERNERGGTPRSAGRIAWPGALLAALILSISAPALHAGEAIPFSTPHATEGHVLPATPVDEPSSTRGFLLAAGSFSIFWISVVTFVWRAGAKHK